MFAVSLLLTFTRLLFALMDFFSLSLALLMFELFALALQALLLPKFPPPTFSLQTFTGVIFAHTFVFGGLGVRCV